MLHLTPGSFDSIDDTFLLEMASLVRVTPTFVASAFIPSLSLKWVSFLLAFFFDTGVANISFCLFPG